MRRRMAHWGDLALRAWRLLGLRESGRRQHFQQCVGVYTGHVPSLSAVAALIRGWLPNLRAE